MKKFRKSLALIIGTVFGWLFGAAIAVVIVCIPALLIYLCVSIVSSDCGKSIIDWVGSENTMNWTMRIGAVVGAFIGFLCILSIPKKEFE